MAAVSGARLLVPIVAEPVSVDDTGEHTVEKQTDMAAVTLVAPDGTRALPVFSSMAAITGWDPEARPVPVTAARAAQAAVSERCDVMVVDLAGPHTVALRPSMVWALAQQRAWVPAHHDETVARAVSTAVREQPDVVAHALSGGTPRRRRVAGRADPAPGTGRRDRAVDRHRGGRAARDRRRDPRPHRRAGLLDLLSSPRWCGGVRRGFGEGSERSGVRRCQLGDADDGVDRQGGIQVREGLPGFGVADLVDG